MAVISCAVAVAVILMGLSGSVLHTVWLASWGSSLNSMVPNTAICLLLLSAGLAAFHFGRPWLARIFGFSAAVLAGTILSQYLTGRDYGIDRLFLTAVAGSSRTSPNAGTAIVLFGLALVFAGSSGPWRRAALACTSGALALALLSLLGYVTGLTPAFRWGTLAGMSLPTATSLLLLTGGFFAAMRARDLPLEASLPLLATGIIILAAISGSSVITSAGLIESHHWVRHSLEIRDLLRRLEQQTETADRIERAHYNSGDPSSLERLALAEAEVWRQFADLRTQLAAAPAQLAHAAALESLLREKLRVLHALLDLGVQGAASPELRRKEVLASLESTDAVSGEIDTMLDDEAKSLTARSAEAEKSAEQTRGITWLAGGVSLVLLAAAIVAGSQARRSREAARLAMEKAHQAAVESSRLKSEFLANMSHELRTPMNGIIGMSELLLEAPLSPEHRDMSEMVLHSAEALLKIINDILDFSKIEAGRMHIDAQPFELRRVMEDCTQLLAPRAHEKTVELVLDYDARLPARYVGDGGRIRQVVMNLAGNAIKFTSAGEVLIRVALTRASETRAGIRVEVRDTGEGIPVEAHGSLFEPFTQADAATTRRFGGTGLGLAISRQLIDLMGGAIGFESQLGSGSMFWFEIDLPLDEMQPPDISAQDLGGRRFLVVDDHANNRKVIAAQLASLGAEAECAAGAEDALSALEQHGPFDVVLLDWHMPGRDGLSLARELRATGRVGAGRSAGEWLVLLSSAASLAQAEAEPLFDAALTKPVRIGELRRCLLRLIQGSSEPPPPPAISASHPPAETALTLLLVEDNLSNQRVARMLLERLGHRVDVAADGEAGLQMLARHRYDAVLMDCQMPVLDGYQATRRIRANEVPGVNANICVIALTANAMPSDRLKCLSAGMSDFVTKPVRLDDLRAVLARCLMNPPA